MQEREEVLVVDDFFAIGEGGEAGVDLVELGAGEVMTELGEAVFEGAAAAVLAEDK